MNLRCLRTFLLGVTIAGALAFGAPAAHAVGETPTVDGNLADLIAAVNANLGSDQGGFAFVDPASDVFTGTCAYVNGYDIVKSYAYFKLKNGAGQYTPNDVTLYLGWEVTGQIGDVDGNGNADTFDSGGPGTGCALSDGGGNTGCASGIGVGESYSILLNLNCSGADDLRLGVSNNKVGILTAGGDLQTELAGGTFCRVGSFLEVSIPHYEELLKAPGLVAIGATLCQANLRMVANAGDDLLAEDTTPVQQLRIPGSIAITKTPASQDACPGTNVSWTIQVCNDGICPFATVTVTDTLDAGLTYVSDDKGSVQGPNAQIRVWTFSNLNPGDCQTISLTSKVDVPCAAAVLNNNVGVEAVEPASPCSQLAEAASAHARASVNCTQPDVNIIKSIGTPTINPGGTTTVTLTIQNTGNSVLDPINVCDKIDGGVSFDAAQAIGGTCGVTLSSNTLNGDGTRTLCFSPFSLAIGASCTISYQVGCVSTGVHPDTATVTAFCKGESQNPIHDRDQSSFTCACPADVEIGKQVNPPTVNPGQDVTVTLTISNPGTTVLDPINVCDKLDAGVSFDAAQTIGGTCGVTLNSNTLNGDGTRTICFTPFSLNPGGSCTITYKVRCVTSGTHPDTATVIGQCKGGGEQDRDQDQAPGSFTCACPPDVEIGKSVTGSPIPGQDATVTLTISNPGQTTLDPINVCDKLDAGVSFDAAQTIGGTCGVTLGSNTLNGDGSRTICFTPFSLPAGGSCTISYKVRCVTPGTHPDTATVVAKCKDGGDQDIDQDQAASSFVCACPADVEIGKSVNPPNVNPGQDVTVTLTISNPGGTVLDPINVCDKLDAGVSFDAGQTIGGTCGVTLGSNTLNGDGTRTICFTPFSLPAGGSCTITYKVRCVTPGQHPDTATVIAQCKDGGEQDRDQDQASSTFTCACPPDVEIGKSVSPGDVKQGEFVTVTLAISNPGTTTLDPINVCDKIDAGVSFDPSQAIGGTCGVTLASNTQNGDGSRTLCFSPFSLNAGQSCTITYRISCLQEGTHPDTATVTARCKDGGENDVDQDRATSSFTCSNPQCCWLTMGGFLNGNFRSGHKDNTFGGNVGPPPSGSWEHIQREGKTATFNFHSHDAHVIQCIDDGGDGPCNPKGDANIILFGGTGTYNFGTGSRDQDAVWTARAEDRGEPGRQGNQTGGCGSADFYSIEVRNAETNEIAFTASGYLDGGNIQIHSCKNAKQVAPPGRVGGKNTLGTNGTSTGVDSQSDAIVPLELYRPQPNPFQNSTSIAYAVGGAGQDVQIGIYNVAGRLIRSLASGFQAAGRYTVQWDGRSADGSTVPGGVYFLRAYVGGQQMSAAASRILYLR